MDAKQLAHYRRRLSEERHRHTAMVDRLNADGLAQSMSDTFAEMAMYDNHPADVGSEMFERQKDLGLRFHSLAMLRRIDEAEARMTQGQYGLCDVCGRPIDPERLEALPMAADCIGCAQAEEALPEAFVRPIEEQVLNPPFGRSWRDNSDYAAYDGEDTWQDVGFYGTSETPQDVPGAITYDDLYRSDEEPGIVMPVEQAVDDAGEPLPESRPAAE